MSELANLINMPNIMRVQGDGAKVYITKISDNKYNFLIYNSVNDKVVTALRHIKLQDIINFSKNYGWHL